MKNNFAPTGIRMAQKLAPLDRKRALANLNEIFRAGKLPGPDLDGRYAGEFIAVDIAAGLTRLAERIAAAWMPWQGKVFYSSRQEGENILSRDSFALAHIIWPLYRRYLDDGPQTYRAFPFRTYPAPGLADLDRQVLKLDYDLEVNPALSVRRVLDELVQVSDGYYLGKAHLKWWWGRWQLVAYFTLSKERIPR